MGKSSSCFRLITCGGDPSEKDDHHQIVSENNSNDKRGWSFRKKSARHRVLSNTAVTETTSSANKGSSECTSINFESLTEPNVEKVYTTNISNEKPQLSNLASSEMSETIVTETGGKVDAQLPESVAIIIQAAIRGFLAQRALLKSKNAVKLQAAVRGHLVRRHAVGTLRCVQAIVKMQLLVRAQNAKQSRSENLLNDKDGKNDCLKALGNEHHVSDVTKSNVTHTSIEKLLKNRFASQLLESTPKNKPTRIKCDPSKADSAWKWLERWMSVSSKDSAEYKNPISMSEQPDEIKDSSDITQSEIGIPSEVSLQRADSTPTVADSPLLSKDDEKTTTYDANNFNIEASSPTFSLVIDNLEQAPTEKTIADDAKAISTEIDSFQIEKMESEEEKKVTTYDVDNFSFQESHSTTTPIKDNLDQAPIEKEITGDAKVNSTETDSFQDEKIESLASVQEEPSSLPQKPEIDGEKHKQSTETFTLEQLETEGKKSMHGSRKVNNPAFVAAQSNFEELSLMANSGRSSSLSNQDAPVESQADTSLVVTDTVRKSKEVVSSEISALYPSRIGGSESGTELSISSTLDSPDRSDVGIMESEHNAKASAERIGNPESKMDNGVEAKTVCATPASNLPNADLNQSEIVHDISDSVVPSVIHADSKEPVVEPEENASEPLREKKETSLQDSKLSPQASPRSHMTIPESQGTPSSQVSVKTKESKANKSGSRNRRRTLSAGNKSPANAHDSGGSRGSREQLPKDQLSGKRRKSFGTVKSDHVDQEQRDDSSNSSVPRFMQATESARAKINANNSPISSPDVHDQDVLTKKRHSLAAGKQGSPRVQGSTSNAQQGTKGNGVHALHERKWQR